MIFGQLSAQKSSLILKTNSAAYTYGDSIFFTIKDPSLSINNNAIIQVELLTDDGKLIAHHYLQLNDNKACGFFENKRVNKGVLILRAFTTHQNEIQNLVRQVVFINAEAKMPAQIPFEVKDDQIRLSIYPESIHLLAGFRNRILIKAEDKQFGLPLSTSFEIFSPDNKLISTLKTDINGMLVVDFGMPEEGSILLKSIGGSPLVTIKTSIILRAGSILNPSFAMLVMDACRLALL